MAAAGGAAGPEAGDAAAGGQLTDEQLLEVAGQDALEDVKELTLRSQRLQSFEGLAARLPNLQILSLSHNHIATLAGFHALVGLVSVNLNFNALTSLDGIQRLSSLQHLYLASNRVRDVSPVAALGALRTLHLFRNAVASLDATVAALAQLPELRELELGGNPCSAADDYRHRLVAELALDRLDGDAVTQVDRDLADAFYASCPGAEATTAPPRHGDCSGGCGCSGSGERPDVLTLDGGPEAEERLTAPTGRLGSGSGSGPAGRRPGRGSPVATPPAALGLPPRPGSAVPGAQQARPGTSGGPSARPGSSGGRPGTAAGAFGPQQSTVQLLSDELLNDHPLVLEYLAKHVLQEAMALVQPNGSGSSNGGGIGKASSFAQRLRDTAAAMSSCEALDAKALAGQQDLIASASSARRAAVQQVVATASVHDLCRQLIRLCEVGPAGGRVAAGREGRGRTPRLAPRCWASARRMRPR